MEALLFNARLEKKVSMLRAKLGELEKVTKSLQREDATIQSAQVYFDSVLESYPRLQNQFESEARIVHNSLFEAVMLKIQERREELVDEGGKDAVLSLLLCRGCESTYSAPSDAFL